MEIHVSEFMGRWGFDIVTKNRHIIAESTQSYANKRNAVDAAKLIAGSKIKVVVKE